MSIYLANYMDVSTFEADFDDRDCDFSVSDACPQFSRLSTRMTDEWVLMCKADVEEDVREALEEDDLRWSTDGWKESKDGRSSQTFSLHVGDGDEAIAYLVVQRVEPDEV